VPQKPAGRACRPRTQVANHTKSGTFSSATCSRVPPQFGSMGKSLSSIAAAMKAYAQNVDPKPGLASAHSLVPPALALSAAFGLPN
jgi:hypothetical protein